MQTRNWSLLVSVAMGDKVLDLSGDSGETASHLKQVGAQVLALRRSPETVDQLNASGVEARAAMSLAEAALPPGAFDAVIAALGDVLTEVGASSLKALSSCLAPGGCLFLSLDNSLWAGRSGRWIRKTFLGAAQAAGGRGAGCGRLMRRLPAAGFEDVRVFGALPDRPITKFLVPLGEPEVERYFIDTMVGRSSWKLRAARQLARVAVRLGLFKELVPAYEVLALRAEAL